MLQPLIQAQATYFKASFLLKKLLNALHLIGNCSLISCDDTLSMYANIGTDQYIDSACLPISLTLPPQQNPPLPS